MLKIWSAVTKAALRAGCGTALRAAPESGVARPAQRYACRAHSKIAPHYLKANLYTALRMSHL